MLKILKQYVDTKKYLNKRFKYVRKNVYERMQAQISIIEIKRMKVIVNCNGETQYSSNGNKTNTDAVKIHIHL